MRRRQGFDNPVAFRPGLTPVETATAMKRRKELFEAKASIGTNCSETRREGRPSGFASDTAKKAGITKKTINLAIQRAEHIAPDVRADIARTSLDKGVELDALAKLPPDEQRRLADAAKAGEVVTARQALPPAQTKRLFDKSLVKPLLIKGLPGD